MLLMIHTLYPVKLFYYVCMYVFVSTYCIHKYVCTYTYMDIACNKLIYVLPYNN